MLHKVLLKIEKQEGIGYCLKLVAIIHRIFNVGAWQELNNCPLHYCMQA
jgi:hypothetical protein